MNENNLLVTKMWNLIDESFFGDKKIKDLTNDEIIIEKYRLIKSSLISETIELNKLVKTDFKFYLEKQNKNIITNSKILTEKIINLNKTKKLIKENVKNILLKEKNESIDNILNKYIKELSISLYLDNLLIYPFIKENKNFDKKFNDEIQLTSVITTSYNMFKREFVDILTKLFK